MRHTLISPNKKVNARENTQKRVLLEFILFLYFVSLSLYYHLALVLLQTYLNLFFFSFKFLCIFPLFWYQLIFSLKYVFGPIYFLRSQI